MKKSNHFSLEKISNNSYYFTIGERGNGKRYYEKLIKERRKIMKSKYYYEELDNTIIDIIKEKFNYIKTLRSEIDFGMMIIYYKINFGNFGIGLTIKFSDIEIMNDNEEIEKFIVGNIQKGIINHFMKEGK